MSEERKEANIHPDKAHGGKPDHVDVTQPFSDGEMKGADKTEVDHGGNVIGGSTHVGKGKSKW